MKFKGSVVICHVVSCNIFVSPSVTPTKLSVFCFLNHDYCRKEKPSRLMRNHRSLFGGIF
jgi:hypothetical protein